jgi:hypothetical protein
MSGGHVAGAEPLPQQRDLLGDTGLTVGCASIGLSLALPVGAPASGRGP